MSAIVIGRFDAALLDKRVIENLLESEIKENLEEDYFQSVQTEIKVSHRKILLEWMLDIHDACDSPYDVFQNAVAILDHLLSMVHVEKKQLQKTGATCLMIAGKVRDIKLIGVANLVWAACDLYTAADLREQEKEVLKNLAWNIMYTVPHDFVGPLLLQLGYPPSSCPQLSKEIGKKCNKIMVEVDTRFILPSKLAAVALLATLKKTSVSKVSDLVTTQKQVSGLLGCSQEELMELQLKLNLS